MKPAAERRRPSGPVVVQLAALFLCGCGGSAAGGAGADGGLPDADIEVSADIGTIGKDTKQMESVEAGALDVVGPDLAADATDTLFVDAPADTAAPPADIAPPDLGSADSQPEAAQPDTAQTIAEKCFPLINGSTAGPDYDQFNPVVASHCFGTDHQEIENVEEVVFLGDSVTVGSPDITHPLSIDNSHFYRNLLAEWLATKFSLDKGNILDWGLWKSYDYFSGKGGKIESGDFRHCAKWGAKTDDFIDGQNQIGECFPGGGSSKRTLVVFTMGGNDISSVTEDGAQADEAEVLAGYPAMWAEADSVVAYLDEAVQWLKDPARFPNGSFVVFATPFEFTDGTGIVSACPAANLVGYKEWADESSLEAIVIYILESYMEIAVKYKADLVWVMEHFCGHGYVATGPDGATAGGCYLGPDAKLWFDETCIHPNDPGHKAIFEMMQATVVE